MSNLLPPHITATTAATRTVTTNVATVSAGAGTNVATATAAVSLCTVDGRCWCCCGEGCGWSVEVGASYQGGATQTKRINTFKIRAFPFNLIHF